MSAELRAVVHLDLDAFYAAVEVLENPELEGKPVLVGGSPGERGVVSSASYPARAFGIRSAMPTSRALALCPDAVVLPPRHRLYHEYSQRVMRILHQTSRLVEQISVDEAFLDVTDQLASWEEAVTVARLLQRRVMEETSLSASIGVATNKLVAKIASDRDKPGGLVVVWPGDEASFLAPLPVRVLWGVGPVMAQKLAAMGIHTVGGLAQAPEAELGARLGRQGKVLARQAKGVDSRPVVTEHEAKSVSQERTFAQDVTDEEALHQQIWKLSEGVGRRLKRAGLAAGTVALKLRYSDFTTLTRQASLAVPTDDDQEIYRTALVLLNRVWKRGQAVRLLGVCGRDLSPPSGQLPLL